MRQIRLVEGDRSTRLVASMSERFPATDRVTSSPINPIRAGRFERETTTIHVHDLRGKIRISGNQEIAVAQLLSTPMLREDFYKARSISRR